MNVLHTHAGTPIEPLYLCWSGGAVSSAMCRAYPGEPHKEFVTLVDIKDIAEGADAVLKALPAPRRVPPPVATPPIEMTKHFVMPPASKKRARRVAVKRIRKELQVSPVKDMGAAFL